MKRRQLLEHLQRHGCRLEREGSRDSIFFNAATGARCSVQRHCHIDKRLGVKICRQFGIPEVGKL